MTHGACAAPRWVLVLTVIGALPSLGMERPAALLKAQDTQPLPFTFVNTAHDAGLTAITVYGGAEKNRYLLETTGCGVAVLDVDGDGWLDLFIVNGSTLEGFPRGQAPMGHLYRNRHDGTYEDVTAKSGIVQTGWGQGACAADYDNDGHDDLFVTAFGENHLFHNRGDGTFEDVTARLPASGPSHAVGRGLRVPRLRPRRPARSVRRQLHRSRSRDGAGPRIGPLPATKASRSPAARQASPAAGTCSTTTRGNQPFEDVSDRSGMTRASGTYGLGVSTLDFNDDGWTDLYVANDSNPSALYLNNHDGTFKDVGVTAGCAYSQDGKPQAGMGVGDRRLRSQRDDRHLQDQLRRRHVDALREQRQGLLRRPHVRRRDRPQHAVARMGRRLRRSRQRRLARPVPRQRPRLPGGRAAQDRGRLQAAQGRLPQPRERAVSRMCPSGWALRSPRRPPAVARRSPISTTTATPTSSSTTSTRRPTCSASTRHRGAHWLTLKLVGHALEPERDRRARAAGRRRRHRRSQEVRGGGSYYSQNDLRAALRPGSLGDASTRVEVRWPNGLEEQWPAPAIEPDPDAHRRHRHGSASCAMREPVVPARGLKTTGRRVVFLALLAAALATGAAAGAHAQSQAAMPDPSEVQATLSRRPRARSIDDQPAAAIALLQRARSRRPCRRRAAARRRLLPCSTIMLRAIDRLAPIAESLPEGSIEQREAVQVLGLSYFLAGPISRKPCLGSRPPGSGRPAMPSSGTSLGQAYVQIHQPDKARAAFAACSRCPETPPPRTSSTAQMMIRLEFEALAEAELRRAIAQEPKLPRPTRCSVRWRSSAGGSTRRSPRREQEIWP